MKNKLVPLEEVNALVTEPSIALGVEGQPEVAIVCISAKGPDWSTELERVVSGCIVLGYKRILFDLRGAEVTDPFQIACIISAWHLLVEVGGTFLMSSLSDQSIETLKEQFDPKLFNIFDDIDDGISWIGFGFDQDLKQKFPRIAKCKECGTEGTVHKRGDHLCDECGMTYMITERGELPF